MQSRSALSDGTCCFPLGRSQRAFARAALAVQPIWPFAVASRDFVGYDNIEGGRNLDPRGSQAVAAGRSNTAREPVDSNKVVSLSPVKARMDTVS